MKRLNCKKSLFMAALGLSAAALIALDLVDCHKGREAKSLKKRTKKNKISLNECNGCFVFNFK